MSLNPLIGTKTPFKHRMTRPAEKWMHFAH